MKAIIIIAVLVLSGCSPRETLEKVTCDSGFTTKAVYWAYVDDGVVSWKVSKDDNFSRRKMLPGEICTRRTWRVRK